MERRKAKQLKDGDKVRLKANLVVDKMYGCITLLSPMKFEGTAVVTQEDPEDGAPALSTGYYYSHLMIEKA